MLNKDRVKIPGFSQVDFFFLILFFLSFFHSSLGFLFNVVLIYYWKFGTEGCLKSLIFLTTRGLLNPAIAAPASFQVFRWAIVLGASFLILIYSDIKNGRLKNKYNKILLCAILFSAVVSMFNLVISSYPITAVFKVISFLIAFSAVLKGVAVTNEYVNWTDFLVSFYGILYIINIIIIPFKQFRIVNEDFQGIFNHVNIFGIISVLFLAMLLNSEFYKGHKIFRIFMICAVFFMEYLSASRTGMISCIIVCTIYVLNKRMAWIKVAGVIVLLFIGYFFLPQNVVLSIDQGINEFVYKNNATSILDSREETLELYYSKFNEEPLFGTGFMVPYDPEIRDYTLNFDLVVEPGNLLWTLLGDTGIIGVLIFILLFLVLLFNGGISRVYLIAAVFLICMGEMVFFSVNNMAVIIYLVLAVYVFENGKYNPTNTLKVSA